MEIKKGQLVDITTGNYTQREYARALKDFNSENEITRFMETGNYLVIQPSNTDNKPSNLNVEDRFIDWAIRKGLIKRLKANAEYKTVWRS